MKEGIPDILGRCVLGLFAAASVLALVMAGTRLLPLGGAGQGTTPPSERVALESQPAKAEKQQQIALEEKVGKCHTKGGVARLDPLAGYTGCDLPVPKSRSR